MIIFLGHTSLYEPLFLGILPNRFIYELSQKFVAPGADKTLKRPVVGLFWRFLSPGFISITRKRDQSWKYFLSHIDPNSIVVIAPEGRMKRENGFDLAGNKMTIRAGAAEILEALDEGELLIAHSAGLHHVQVPGQFLPKLFKTLTMRLSQIPIKDYKSNIAKKYPELPMKKAIVSDLQERLEYFCS